MARRSGALPAHALRRVLQQYSFVGELLADRVGTGEVAVLLRFVAFVDQGLDAGVVVAGGTAREPGFVRLLQQAEGYLLRVPVFKTIYAPVKQLVVAFSPDNEYGFKRVVMIEDPSRGFLLGFLTREFTVDRGQGNEALIAVYVPTNHLYLGDVIICPRDRASFPDITVEQGIRIFLTGGMALSTRIRARRGDDRVADFRV